MTGYILDYSAGVRSQQKMTLQFRLFSNSGFPRVSVFILDDTIPSFAIFNGLKRLSDDGRFSLP